MGVPRFLIGLFRSAPSKRRLVRSLALGERGGDRTITSADGTELSARRTGDGDPLVVVHGTLDGIGAHSLIELELAERYAVWVYDRRGRGGSGDADDYSIECEVDDLRAVIDAAGGRPHVLGHSMGAVLGLRAAITGAPMRSLIAYEPPINGASAIGIEALDVIRTAVDDGRLDDAIRAMAGGLAGVTDDELAIALGVPPVRKRLRDGVRTAVRECEALRACRWDALPVAEVPTLVVRGGANTASAYPTDEQAERLATDHEIATIPGQGHLAQVFRPFEFADIVLDFLDRH